MHDISELEKLIIENVKSIKNKKSLNILYQELNKLRQEMDKYDSVWKDTNDLLRKIFTFGRKRKMCIAELIDITEDYYKYTNKDKSIVISKLLELSNVNDHSFLNEVAMILKSRSL